jgi:hypothetical protein
MGKFAATQDIERNENDQDGEQQQNVTRDGHAQEGSISLVSRAADAPGKMKIWRYCNGLAGTVSG